MRNKSKSAEYEIPVPDNHGSRRSAWVWFLALSLSLHLVLLLALPVSFKSHTTTQARPLDVVLMPEIVVPAPVPVAIPQRSKKVVAETRESQLPRAQLPEPRPVPDVVSRPMPGVAAVDASPVTAPLAVAGAPATPGGLHAALPRTTADTAKSGTNDNSAPSFNAAYLRNPAPPYPLISRRNGEQGTVTLKVLVTDKGASASVSVDKSSGSGHLDNAALETVRSWRFAPARRGAQPVEAWVLVTIVFRLEPLS